MIRDEYSDEVAELWDALSRDLKRSARDWILLRKEDDRRVSLGGLLGSPSPWIGGPMVTCAQADAYNLYRYGINGQKIGNAGIISSVLGSIGL